MTDLISYRRTNQGAWELTALVSDRDTPFQYYEHGHYFGYTKKEATERFIETLQDKGQELVK